MNPKVKLMVVTSSAFVVTLLLVGAVAGRGASPQDVYRHLQVFTEVLSRIKGEYVEEPDLKHVTLGALNGLLEAIDPFASYLNAEQYKAYQKRKADNQADVGLILSRRYGYLSVVDSIPGSPADAAGLGTGDVIEAIAGVATRDMPLAFAEVLLHGAPGASIEISVLRFRRPEPQKLDLTRAAVEVPAVTTKLLPGEIGWIRVPGLNEAKVNEVASAVRSLEKQGAKKLILDLRRNSTGDPEDGVKLADLFLDQGTITYSEGQKVSRQTFTATANTRVTTAPMVVITNRGTAGGAEVAASALLENRRAEVVGERTYGFAAVRRAISMEDGGAIILAVAKYYTPGGKAIQETGVAPSVAVAALEPREEEDEELAAPEKVPAAEPVSDNVLEKAIETLEKGVPKARGESQRAGSAERSSPSPEMNPLNVPKPPQR